MTPEVALQKREQMIRDGFCVINNILTDTFGIKIGTIGMIQL